MAEATKDNGVSKTKALAPVDEVRQTLTKLEPQIKMALPPQISPEKFIRVVMTAVQQNPKLVENRAALYGAAIKCAQDGLLPDGKEAALVPYGATIQYMPMIAGILKKVRNSGELSSITAQVVYSNDEFAYELGADEKVVHRPLMTGDRGKPVLVYAIAKTKDGGVYREFMTEAQIQDVKNVSKAKDSGPWSGAFADEMRRKTVLRRLSKRLPMSTDLEQVITRDDEFYDLNQPAASNQKPGGKRKNRLDTVIDAQTTDDAPTDAPAKMEAPI